MTATAVQPVQYESRNPKSAAPATTTPIRRKPTLDFSMTGLVYSAMMLFMGLAAVNTQANLLFGVFGLMVGILLVSGVISKTYLHNGDAKATERTLQGILDNVAAPR